MSELIEFSLDTENSEKNYNLAKWYENQGHTAPALTYYLRASERTEDKTFAYKCLIKGYYCYNSQKSRDNSEKISAITSYDYTLGSLCDKAGIQLIFIHGPNYFIPEYMQKGDVIMDRICKNHGIAFINFSKLYANEFHFEPLWYDHLHLNSDAANHYTLLIKKELNKFGYLTSWVKA